MRGEQKTKKDMIDKYPQTCQANEQYVRLVNYAKTIIRSAYGYSMKDCIAGMEDLNKIVELTNRIGLVVREVRTALVQYLYALMFETGIPNNQTILYTRKKPHTDSDETETLTGFLYIGDVPSVYRPTLDAEALLTDSIGLMFQRDGDEDTLENPKNRPLLRLLETDDYTDPEVLIKKAQNLKQAIRIPGNLSDT